MATLHVVHWALIWNIHTILCMWIHSIYRATRWTICWPPTSVRCCPQWTNTLAGATTSDLPIGRRQMSSSRFCALLVSTAAGDVPTPTSCGGWVALVLLAQKNQCSLGKVRLQAAVTPVKVQANITILTMTWMRMSKVMRMTISDTPSDRLVVLTLGFCSVYSQNVYLTWIVEIKLFYTLFYSLFAVCLFVFMHFAISKSWIKCCGILIAYLHLLDLNIFSY